MSSVISHEGQTHSKKANSVGSASSSFTKSPFQDGGQGVMFGYKGHEDGVGSRGMIKNAPYNSHNIQAESVSGQSDTSNSMNDSMQSSPMANYNGNFNRSGYGMNDQHGGMTNTSRSNADFAPPNSQYNQYGQPGMRPGFPPGPGASPAANRTSMPQPGMNMMGPNYTSNQQRFPMSGPSIQQQGGPTPTLNQLLQNPNAAQRYQAGGYGYDSPVPKGNGEMPSGNQSGSNYSQGWSGQPQQQRQPMNPYQQQQMQQGFRPQGQMFNRGGSMGNPPQATNFNHQYPYPGGGGNAGPRFPPRHPNSNSQPFNNQNDSSAPTSEAQSSNPPTENGEHDRSPASQPTQQENSVSSNGGEDSNSTTTSGPTSGPVENGRSNSPTHPSVQALRPSPSPGPGSQQGSRSNTPASLTGSQQAGSPMPNRPPSNQSASSNQGSTGNTHNNFNNQQQQQQQQTPSGPQQQQPPPQQTPQPQQQPPMMPPPGGPGGGPQPQPPPQYNSKPYQQYPPNQQGGYRYPSQGGPGGYPGMYGSSSGVPRPMGYPPYGMQQHHQPPGAPYYNDQQAGGGMGANSNQPGKGGAVQAAQAAMAQAESQSKAGSPRPLDSSSSSMMNGPRSGTLPHQQNSLHTNHIGSTTTDNNAIKNDTAASATGNAPSGGAGDNSSIKSSASATPQPASPESSQDSLTNQTASAGDDENSNQSMKHDSGKQENLSHPNTPVPAPSPSLSSIQEDSSSSWPGTPAPPPPPQQTTSQTTAPTPTKSSAKFSNQDVFARQCEMGDEPDRKQWLETLFNFMEEKGTPVNVLPTISKNAVDLYRLYHLTKERGGLVEVTRQKKWRDISTALNIGSSSSAGFTLKKNYCKYVFPYECRYDNNNCDPAPILAQIEAAQKKDSRKSNSGNNSSNSNSNNMMGGPMMPPNVSMMPNANNPGAGGGMYDQQGAMMNMQDQYGNGGNGQYPRMGNHYGGPNGPNAPSSSTYDNRVFGGRPNDQYNNFHGGAGQQGYYPGGGGYQPQQKGPGMYPGQKPGPPYSNSPYQSGQWSGDRQRSFGGSGGAPVSSASGPPPPSSSPSPGPFGSSTPPLYKQQRMSPQRSTDSKASLYQQGKQLSNKPGANFAPKKDIVFPPDSVEATEPKLAKRKKLSHKDIEKVDAWRLLMCLKSGLLAESTWALDTLNVLLYDDHTVHYFGLSHMPGLLEVLTEHLRRCLIEIFGAPFSELEVLNNKKAVKATPLEPAEAAEEAECKAILEATPFGSESWDISTGVQSSSNDWQKGKGDTTLHVVTHMESKRSVDFYRRKFLKRRASSPADGERDIKQEKKEEQLENIEIKKENVDEENSQEVADEDGDQLPAISNLLSDARELVNSIQCNEMDKKYLERLKRTDERGDEESEAYQYDTPPLCLLTDCQEELSRRCVCVSNILRNLSFIPGNDREMSRHSGLLSLVGQLLLLHHWHPKRRRRPRPPSVSENTTSSDVDEEDSCAGERGGNSTEWWWDTLECLRENALVLLSNIAGHLHLAMFSDEICMPILNGLLHWSVCPSACAQDPLPSVTGNSPLSAQRLVLEALCKLCVTDTNVDLLLATPPFSRIVKLFSCLVRQLSDRSDQVLREFSIVLLSSLVAGNGSAARAVALQHPAITLLIDFINSAEQSATQILSSHGSNGVRMLQENPDLMGTSLDMLRRAATALKQIAEVPENRCLFSPHQERLLALVMSQALDATVSKQLSNVLYLISMPFTDDQLGDEDTASNKS